MKKRAIISFSIAGLFILAMIGLMIYDLVSFNADSKLPKYGYVLMRMVEFIPLALIASIFGIYYTKKNLKDIKHEKEEA